MKVTKLKLCLFTVLLCSGITALGFKSDTDAHSKPLLSDKKIDSIFNLETIYLNNAWPDVKATKKMPRSTEKGLQPIGDWTSGFYPGCLWLIYAYTHASNMEQKAAEATAMLAKEQYNITDHDIGFRIYCSYGRGYLQTKSAAYRNVIIQSAKSAITRYNPTVKAIMSWTPNIQRDWKFPVIIDNMMNLQLLLMATELSSDTTYRNVAIHHALTTLKNQYRTNNSCSHVVDYDPQTGEKRKMDWNNGNNDPSTAAWSRGQSWGLYGFTFMYKYTHQKVFLDQAEKIAAYILSNPNLPADKVPYWDYTATPGTATVRDASAAALLASALMQLSEVAPQNSKHYFKSGEQILVSLASPAYLNQSGKGDYLLKHATGNFLQQSEVDGSLIYADYYFLEALSYYKKLRPKY